MLHHLTGRIQRKTPTEVILDVSGVGYEVAIPVSTFEALPQGGEVTLLVRVVTRNDASRLYGFATEAEREIFRLVTTVQGVGPSSALSLLSSLSPGEFRMAVADQDLELLQRSKGIGRKTAARIAAELQDKVKALPLDGEGPVAGRTETAVAALVNLGYSRNEARKVVAKAQRGLADGVSVEELIRAALRSGAARK